jgi:arsenite-transporting ATPase
MAKLEELVADARFDVVVLDTPPARDARSFLEAPDRLEAFLRGAALRRLLAPGRGAARLLGRGTGLLMPALRRVAGVQALEDVRVFRAVIEDLLGGFHERAVAVRALLADRSTAFVVVSSTEDAALADAAAFAAALRAAGRTPAAVVVNRVHALDPAFDPGRAVTRLEAAGLPPRTARQAVAVHADVQVLARRDAAAVARAREAVGAPAVSVAQRPGGPHDLRALAAVAREMLASGETRSESRASYG